MRKTEENIQLECILNDKEKADYAKMLAEKVTEKSGLEDSLKSAQTQMKAEITACEAMINSHANKVNTGREFRYVKCNIKYDFKKKIKSWVREDTKKVVKEGVIPFEEMQEELPDK